MKQFVTIFCLLSITATVVLAEWEDVEVKADPESVNVESDPEVKSVQINPAQLLLWPPHGDGYVLGEFTLLNATLKPASIYVPDSCSERTKQAAKTLSKYLRRITGKKFPVADKPSERTIHVYTQGHNETVDRHEFFISGPGDEENFAIRSTPDQLHVKGIGEIGVEHAVWDLLHRFGYRQFFPGKHWEVVPKASELKINVDYFDQPSYTSREIFYGYGFFGENKEHFENWVARNRMSNGRDGFTPFTAHAYAGILAGNEEMFEAHPEYLPLLKFKEQRIGFPVSIKFCTSNRELRQFMVAHALRYFEKRPNADCVSLDPSDLGNWCQCERCQAQGTVTDRAMSIINDAAAALREAGLDKYVGFQAYHQHAMPPTGKVEPNVIASIATSLRVGDLTMPQLIKQWSDKGAVVGIREYYGFIKWHWDLPGTSRAGNPRGIAASLKQYHELGARFVNAESSDNWGVNGLGYYVAARCMWDVKEADRVDEIIEDFLTRAFGPANEPMRVYYSLNDGANKHKLTDEHVQKMFAQLQKAYALAKDEPAVQQRIRDLVLYMHYVRLYRDWRGAGTEQITREIQIDAPPVERVPNMKDDVADDATADFMDDLLEKPASKRKATVKIKTTPKREALEKLLRYVYQIRGRMMVHYKGIYRVLTEDAPLPNNVGWMVHEPANPWKVSKPIEREWVESLLEAGVNQTWAEE